MLDTRLVRGGLGSLLAVMCAALGLVIGAGSSLALALPELARSTGATQTELTWVVNVYALVFAALLLPVGIAADRFGRRGVPPGCSPAALLSSSSSSPPSGCSSSPRSGSSTCTGSHRWRPPCA